MRKKTASPETPRARRASGTDPIASGISDMLRAVSHTLGEAYAEVGTHPDLIAALEIAKQQLLQARGHLTNV